MRKTKSNKPVTFTAWKPECQPPVYLDGKYVKWEELNQYAKDTGDIAFPLHVARFRAWRKKQNDTPNKQA